MAGRRLRRSQARLHADFLDLLAGIHRIDVSTGHYDFLPGAIRRTTNDTLVGEVDRWERYLAWAAEDDIPPVFADGVAWCRTRLPVSEPPASLLWGDVQLGNVLVADDMTIAAVLDFEMASLGPAELDLAWFLVLHRMTVERCGGDLPGFPGRAATMAAYEDRLGRALVDLRWFEVFAALRSGAIMVRAARLLGPPRRRRQLAHPGEPDRDAPGRAHLRLTLPRSGRHAHRSDGEVSLSVPSVNRVQRTSAVCSASWEPLSTT